MSNLFNFNTEDSQSLESQNFLNNIDNSQNSQLMNLYSQTQDDFNFFDNSNKKINGIDNNNSKKKFPVLNNNNLTIIDEENTTPIKSQINNNNNNKSNLNTPIKPNNNNNDNNKNKMEVEINNNHNNNNINNPATKNNIETFALKLSQQVDEIEKENLSKSSLNINNNDLININVNNNNFLNSFINNSNKFIDEAIKIIDNLQITFNNYLDEYKKNFINDANLIKNLLILDSEKILENEEKNKIIDEKLNNLFNQMIAIFNDNRFKPFLLSQKQNLNIINNNNNK